MTDLIIDTSDNKKIFVGLSIDSKKYFMEEAIGSRRTQVVLPLIDKLLKKHSLKIENISSIRVNVGPGSFTGLRVGLAIANTLSYVLKIPVNGENKTILPKYSSSTKSEQF